MNQIPRWVSWGKSENWWKTNLLVCVEKSQQLVQTVNSITVCEWIIEQFRSVGGEIHCTFYNKLDGKVE